MLKLYYREVKAIRITRGNFQKLKKLDEGDGVLEEGIECVVGDWFVETDSGFEVMAGNVSLIPIKKRK